MPLRKPVSRAAVWEREPVRRVLACPAVRAWEQRVRVFVPEQESAPLVPVFVGALE